MAESEPAGAGLSPRSRRIVVVLICATVAAIVTAIVMACIPVGSNTLWYEIGKLVAQAGILSGFGAVITLLTHEYQLEQEQARKRVDALNQRSAARHEWLREFAVRITDAYSETKQARRRLQWDLDENKQLPVSIYDSQLIKLSKVQSQFETLQTMASTSLVSDDRQRKIECNLECIEKALSDLVSERKGHPLPPQGGGVTRRRTTRLRRCPSIARRGEKSLVAPEKMDHFLAQSGTEEFKGIYGFGRIKSAYKEALDSIIVELQDAQPPAPWPPPVKQTHPDPPQPSKPNKRAVSDET